MLSLSGFSEEFTHKGKIPVMIKNYEQKVYEALLGKIIGVYVGRPFEGWWKDSIERELGFINGYVHEKLGKSLVVSDDDISGTCTFIRALEDSGKLADTPEDFFGETWLNYIIEEKCILWWGGRSVSSEHTAFLNLKEGIPSPASGSIAENGKLVAEQIGAQIFIDAFGMVAPGNPELAAELAGRSASVSHDGEAVYAAQVVAAMVSIAFVEHDIHKIMDEAIKIIPADSLIAKIHREVRSWSEKDGDWNKTYDRIFKKYGYNKYGGGCHVVPNHAIMVMAWAYSENNFHKSMGIINTAGWDTDCNSGNVGSVMGLVAGLDKICADYDYQSPFADRIHIPTADGTDSASDVLRIAMKIAALGRNIMGWPALDNPKLNAWHHFEMDRALHGYMNDDSTFETRGNARVANRKSKFSSGKSHSMEISFTTGGSAVARVLTPVMIGPGSGGYSNVSTPHLYNSMAVHVAGKTEELIAPASMRLVAMTSGGVKLPNLASEWRQLKSGKAFKISWKIEGCESSSILQFGFEIASESSSSGIVLIDNVRYSGKASVCFNTIPDNVAQRQEGWISSLDTICGTKDLGEEATKIGVNSDVGILVTGTRYWSNASIESNIALLSAKASGLVLRYQGLRRYYSAVISDGMLKIVLNNHGTKVLAETPFAFKAEKLFRLRAEVKGNLIAAYVNNEKLLSVRDATLKCGGAGFTVERGVSYINDIRIEADAKSGL